MSKGIPVKVAKRVTIAMAIAAFLSVTAGTASAAGTVIYNNIPKPQPGNVPSLGYEATSTFQFGGEIEPASESLTTTKVRVGMSSWACQSGTWNEHTCVTSPGAKFSWPITLHIHAVGPGNSVGTEVGRLTQTFRMPYRPSKSVKCENGGWGSHCYNGKMFKIVFSLRGIALPEPAIVSVSYNTSHYGSNPTGCTENCPYDALNVAVEEGTPTSPTVGTQPSPADAFLRSTWAGAYCNGAEGTGTFRLDPGCWEGYQPLFTVETK